MPKKKDQWVLSLKVIAENSRILRLVDKVRQGVKLRTEEMDEIISYRE